MNQIHAVEMKQIVKRFGKVLASDHVDFTVKKGEIHALLGENGAGKSTIMSMLSGVYRADSGRIQIHGQAVTIRSPKHAMELGIGMVFQNFRLVPTLTAAENIILGEKTSFMRGKNWMKQKEQQIVELADKFGLSIASDRPVWQLSVGEQQRVEIVKTLYRGANIIILDEPTSVLTPAEADQLFLTLKQMKDEGKTIVLTTHKLKEVLAASDRISVMCKGKMIETLNREETNERALTRLMVGREIEFSFSRKEQKEFAARQEPVLMLKDITAVSNDGRAVLNGIDLTVHKGEIVGIAGVAGNGQSELAEVSTGLRAWQSGTFWINGRELNTATVRGLIEEGVAHVPENRMKTGLAGSLGSVDNLLLKSYRTKERSTLGFLRSKSNRSWSKQLVEQFDVKTADLDTPVQYLSGGNQQKLLFAREIHQDPILMVAVHPTQGLDVGASEAVYQMLFKLRETGRGVLLISEDLDEVMHLSDRILVMYNGKINGEISRAGADKEKIGMLMAGFQEGEGAAG